MIGRHRHAAAFSLVEVVISVAVVSVGFLASYGLVGTAREYTARERERTLAHQAAVRQVETIRTTPFPQIVASSETITLWDNETPDNLEDDLTARRTVILTSNAGTVLAQAPQQAQLLNIEVTVSWNPRGRRSGAVLSETIFTQVMP